MDYRRNRQYFSSINWVLLAVLVVLSCVVVYFFTLIGIILLLGIGGYIAFKFWYTPKDEDIDAIYQEQIGIIVQRGYDQLGKRFEVEQVGDPIVVHGPSLNAISYDPAVKRGSDTKTRSSNHEITVFYLGKEQLYHYSYCFSVIDDEKNESITEYNYEDIITTAHLSVMRPYYSAVQDVERFAAVELFKLSVVDGTSIECPVTKGAKVEEQLNKLKTRLYLKRKESSSV